MVTLFRVASLHQNITNQVLNSCLGFKIVLFYDEARDLLIFRRGKY